MTQTEADKLLELYHKDYEIYYKNAFCELYDDGTFYCKALYGKNTLTGYIVGNFDVKQDVLNWINL